MGEFSSSGFQVLAFPSNDFNLQEPGETADEILNGIKWVRPGGGYVPKFQMFEKIDVNGKDEHPLYTYLKSVCGPTSEEFEDLLFYAPLRVSDVRWNFEIFLISKTGIPLYRYSPDHSLTQIRTDIQTLLNHPEVGRKVEFPVEVIEEATNQVAQDPNLNDTPAYKNPKFSY